MAAAKTKKLLLLKTKLSHSQNGWCLNITAASRDEDACRNRLGTNKRPSEYNRKVIFSKQSMSKKDMFKCSWVSKLGSEESLIYKFGRVIFVQLQKFG